MARPRPALLSPATTRRIVEQVLNGERQQAEISVTFVSGPAMRKLNREWLGHDYVTDVITFPLPAVDGTLLGDVYICPAFAKGQAKEHGVPLKQELMRLVVHGTLHVLGYTHPEGSTRTRSPMWRRQERYLKALV
jgi:probable rRNA maturation factor